MATQARFKLSALTTPAGIIPSLASRDIDQAIEEYVLMGDGRTNPTFAAAIEAKPMAAFTTPAIRSSLSILGTGFYSWGMGTNTSNVDLYLAKQAMGAAIATGSVHSRLRGTRGCIVPRKISAKHGKEAAMFNADVYFLSRDGSLDATAFTVGVSLPSLATGDEAYTLGPVKLNGIWLDSVMEWEYDFGYQEEIVGSDGDLLPTFGGYMTHAPKLTIKSEDANLRDTYGGSAFPLTGSNALFLRRMVPAGRAPDSLAQHIRIGLTKGLVRIGKTSEKTEGASDNEIMITPVIDGASTTSLISTLNLATSIS
jgi:hypothetical protein